MRSSFFFICKINNNEQLTSPYGRPHALTMAQVFSILGFIFSWTWWLTLLTSLPTMIVLQVVWCYRLNRGWIIAVGVLSTLTTILSIMVGVFWKLEWNYTGYRDGCPVWIVFGMYDDESEEESSNSCNSFAILAFINAAFMGSTACLIWYVLCSGKFDKMVEELCKNDEKGDLVQELRKNEKGDPEAGIVVVLPVSPSRTNETYGDIYDL